MECLSLLKFGDMTDINTDFDNGWSSLMILQPINHRHILYLISHFEKNFRISPEHRE